MSTQKVIWVGVYTRHAGSTVESLPSNCPDNKVLNVALLQRVLSVVKIGSIIDKIILHPHPKSNKNTTLGIMLVIFNIYLQI